MCVRDNSSRAFFLVADNTMSAFDWLTHLPTTATRGCCRSRAFFSSCRQHISHFPMATRSQDNPLPFTLPYRNRPGTDVMSKQVLLNNNVTLLVSYIWIFIIPIMLFPNTFCFCWFIRTKCCSILSSSHPMAKWHTIRCFIRYRRQCVSTHSSWSSTHRGRQLSSSIGALLWTSTQAIWFSPSGAHCGHQED